MIHTTSTTTTHCLNTTAIWNRNPPWLCGSTAGIHHRRPGGHTGRTGEIAERGVPARTRKIHTWKEVNPTPGVGTPKWNKVAIILIVVLPIVVVVVVVGRDVSMDLDIVMLLVGGGSGCGGVMIQFLTPYFSLWRLHKCLAGLTFIFIPHNAQHPVTYHLTYAYHLTHPCHFAHDSFAMSHPLSIITNGWPFGETSKSIYHSYWLIIYLYSGLLTYWFIIGW